MAGLAAPAGASFFSALAGSAVKAVATGLIAKTVMDAFTPDMPDVSPMQPRAPQAGPSPVMPDAPEAPVGQQPNQGQGNQTPATGEDVAQGMTTGQRQRRGRLSTILSQRQRVTEPLGGLYDSETLG